MFDQNGRSTKNAKLSMELGELCEKSGDVESAITWYNKAADYYRQENSAVTASHCKIKV